MQGNEWNLATGHYHYAKQIPRTIDANISASLRASLPTDLLNSPIGGDAIMHSHQTMATMAQKYKTPMWLVPDCDLEAGDRSTIGGNAARYRETKSAYHTFAQDILSRLEAV
jgi:hypothetical protein